MKEQLQFTVIVEDDGQYVVTKTLTDGEKKAFGTGPDYKIWAVQTRKAALIGEIVRDFIGVMRALGIIGFRDE